MEPVHDEVKNAPAGKSTRNRLELTPADASAAARYQKGFADPQAREDDFIAGTSNPSRSAKPSPILKPAWGGGVRPG